MKIFSWTGPADQGQTYIRSGLPLDEIARHGHTVRYRNYPTPEEGAFDTWVGCRISLPKPSQLWVHGCGMYGGPFMVFETDDDNLNISPYNDLSVKKYWSDPAIRFNYLANLRVSHRIVTSTPYLANLLQDQTGHPDIVVAENTIPGWMIELVPNNHQADELLPAKEEVIVGWAGGASHYGDWQWTKGGIRRALANAPNAKLRLVGGDFRRLLKVKRMEYVPWYDSVEGFWRDGLTGIDIGLAPLRPEGFNRSKSDIKVKEYAARGIPVVAQDYGPYKNFVEDGFTGYLVKTNKEWTEAILALVRDPALRRRMGAAAREKAKNYTIEKLYTQYLEAYTP